MVSFPKQMTSDNGFQNWLMLRPLLEDKLWVKQYFIHRKYIHLSTIHNVQDLTVSKVLIYKPSPDKL